MAGILTCFYCCDAFPGLWISQWLIATTVLQKLTASGLFRNFTWFPCSARNKNACPKRNRVFGSRICHKSHFPIQLFIETKIDCLSSAVHAFSQHPGIPVLFSLGAPPQIPAAITKDSFLRLPSHWMFFLPQKWNHSSHNSSPVSSPSAHYGCWPAGESHPSSVSHAHFVIYSILSQ